MTQARRSPASSNLISSLITKRQGEFLAFILRCIQKNAIAPSHEDMATHFGVSSPSVNGMRQRPPGSEDTPRKDGF